MPHSRRMSSLTPLNVAYKFIKNFHSFTLKRGCKIILKNVVLIKKKIVSKVSTFKKTKDLADKYVWSWKQILWNKRLVRSMFVLSLFCCLYLSLWRTFWNWFGSSITSFENVYGCWKWLFLPRLMLWNL